MVLLLKLISLVVLIFGGVQIYSAIKEVEARDEKIKKLGVGCIILVIGFVLFPSWSNKNVKAQEWAHTKFREVYWNSTDLIEEGEAIISSNVFYLDNPDSETIQPFKELDIEIKEAQKKIEENKIPWYLTNSIYKKGKKIMKLQDEQLELLKKESKGFQKKGKDFFGDSFKIEEKIEKIDDQINDILEADNILYC